jgi:hypothetical protein
MARTFLAASVFLIAVCADSYGASRRDSSVVNALQLAQLGLGAQPNVVAHPRGGFVLSYQAKLSDGCHALRTVAISSRGALGAVNEVARGCDWFVNWADFPSLAIADNGDWLTYYLKKSGSGPYAYDIYTVRSKDQGKHWEPGFRIHDDGTPTEHGFVSIAPAGGDAFLVVWLDGRFTQANASGHSGHDHAQANESRMTLRSVRLSRAQKTQHALEVDADVCTCCLTDLVRTGAEQFSLVYRDRLPGEVRDISLATFNGVRWSAKGQVHADGWRIAGCPVNGPAIAQRDAATAVAWSTMQGEDMVVRARVLGQPMHELERGNILGRVDLAARTKGWLAIWLGDGGKGNSALKLGILGNELQREQTFTLATLTSGRNIGMPRLAQQADTALVVWTESDATGPRVAGALIQTKSR